MNKLLRFGCFIILLHTLIIGNQESQEKMQYIKLDSNVETSKNQYCGEGFLQGTLIKTINGYIPIEEIEIEDILVGLDGAQTILSIKKGKAERYLRLLIGDEYVYAGMHQQFYLSNGTWVSACYLHAGNILFDRQYVLESEIIDQSCICYSLSTQEQSYFIYPNIYVHNFDLVTMGVAGTFMLGAIEISNPVTMLLGIIIPLSLYAAQYFKSNIIHNYKIEDKDINIPVHQLCLQSNEVIQKTREYYDIKRRSLQTLYQDLFKIKNEVSVFVKPNNVYKFDFSFGFLSGIQPVIYNLVRLPELSQEIALSVENKEKLMRIREDELEKLQQDIFDINLNLAFHINELIERRNQVKQQLCDMEDNVDDRGDFWNKNVHYLSYDIIFAMYTTYFDWKEIIDSLEAKTNEVKYIFTYYEKLKSHFFIDATTNLKLILPEQINYNKVILEQIVRNKDAWLYNMRVVEDFLRERNALSHQLVCQYANTAKQKFFEQEKNNVALVQKKKDSMKDLIKKELEKQKNSCSSGGDPNDNDPDEDFFEKLKKRADKKARSLKFGMMYRDPLTGLWWSKDMAGHSGLHYKVFKEAARGFAWLFDANSIGEMIIEKHKGPIGTFISYTEVVFL